MPLTFHLPGTAAACFTPAGTDAPHSSFLKQTIRPTSVKPNKR